MKPAATSIRATAATAAVSNRLSVIEHEPRGERCQHDEQYVQVDEQACGLARAAAATTHRCLHRLPANDDERNPERKCEQGQEQLARPDAGHHRREEASEYSHAYSRKQDGRHDCSRKWHAEE